MIATLLQIVLAATSAATVATTHALPVRDANDAISVAYGHFHIKGETLESWRKTYTATLSDKTWVVCKWEPVSRPASGFCIYVGAKDGQIQHMAIMN